VPGDKSISHRALIFGALAVGETRISGLLEGDDVLNTGNAMRELGAKVERTREGSWRIHGVGVGGFRAPADVLDFGNSGTGCRLVLGAVAGCPITATFDGDASLRRRPMQRILDPIGLRIGSWRTLKDGTQPLPTGAFVTAREWRTFGVLVRDGGTWEKKTIVPRAALARCFTGSDANPRYGLGWWLSPLPKHPDVVYASGAGGQAMYVIPSACAVVVKFGGSASYKHDAFLKRLLG